MKVFKNPVTGETFEDISAATEIHCESSMCTSKGCKFYDVVTCQSWAQEHQEEAAELMGLDVEEAEVTPAPRLAEILGVEEDEVWTYTGFGGKYRIHGGLRQYEAGDGNWCNCLNEIDLVELINHPESIIRAPRLTEPEIAIMRAVGAKWVSINKQDGTFFVDLWTDQPTKMPSGLFFHSKPGVLIASAHSSLFPSVKPGECIGLEEGNGGQYDG